MHSFLKAAGFVFLLLPARGPAQVRDTTGADREQAGDTLVIIRPQPRDSTPGRDTTLRPDTVSRRDTSSYVPMAGIGSVAGTGVPAIVLPDTALEFIPFRSTGEILPAFGGIFLAGTGEGGFRRKFSVNGLRDGALIFLNDGLLLNDPSTGMYLAGGYPADYAGVIEFAPPPSGYSAAPGGTGGTIDFVSPGRRAPRPVSRIRYSQSTYGFSLLDGALSQDIIRGLNASLGLQRPVFDGRFINSGFDGWGGRVKLRYDLDGAAVYASDVFNRWERGLNDGISPATPDSLRFESIRAIVVNPSAAEMTVRHDLGAGVAIGGGGGVAGDLTTFDLEFTSAKREYRDEAGDTGSTGTAFRDHRHEQSSGFRIAQSRGIAGNRLTVGVEMRSRRILKDPNIGAHRSTQTGIRGNLVLNAGPALAVTPAARFDRFLDRERLSLGVSLRVRLGGVLTLTGGASRSHRFPSFAEAYGISGLALPLETADPERHDMISAGLFAGDSAGTFASVSVFHRKISGAIFLDSAGSAGGGSGDPPLAWMRSGDESRSGISTVSALRVGSFLAELTSDYLSYGSPTRRRYAPAWNLSGGIYLRDRIAGGHLNLKTGFRGRYFSSYDAEGYAERYELFVPSSSGIPPAGTLDFVLFAGIGDAVIHFIWENLLDRQYIMTSFYPMDERAIRFGLTWKFLD